MRKIQGGREEESGKTRHFHPVLIEVVVFVFVRWYVCLFSGILGVRIRHDVKKKGTEDFSRKHKQILRKTTNSKKAVRLKGGGDCNLVA